jgi:tetratricopeptide (TPR) repeat protein
LQLRGDAAGAEKAFRRALELDRFNHPDYALDLAGLLVRQQKSEAAVMEAKNMLAQYPPAVVNNRASDDTLAPTLANLESLVGNVYLNSGQLKEAGQAADRALALDPHNLRGRALKHQVEKRMAENSAQ